MAGEASCFAHHLGLSVQHPNSNAPVVLRVLCVFAMHCRQSGRAAGQLPGVSCTPVRPSDSSDNTLPAGRRPQLNPTHHLPTLRNHSTLQPRATPPPSILIQPLLAPPGSDPANSSVAPLLSQYAAICASASHPGPGASDEVLYGRAGTLLGGLLLRQRLGPGAVPDAALTQLAQAMLTSGGRDSRCCSACLSTTDHGKGLSAGCAAGQP